VSCGSSFGKVSGQDAINDVTWGKNKKCSVKLIYLNQYCEIIPDFSVENDIEMKLFRKFVTAL
jgi:hypothetical protein